MKPILVLLAVAALLPGRSEAAPPPGPGPTPPPGIACNRAQILDGQNAKPTKELERGRRMF